jgi:hypothetical protein
MTYAQLQFVKAEAAFRLGDKATALAAYRNAISAHIDFVNTRNLDNNQAATQITAAEKAAFLADTRIVPTSPSALTLTQIMTQKYIAQWAWGHNELWMDMRRYHYTDIDPATAAQIYPGLRAHESFRTTTARSSSASGRYNRIRVELCVAQDDWGDQWTTTRSQSGSLNRNPSHDQNPTHCAAGRSGARWVLKDGIQEIAAHAGAFIKFYNLA